MPYVKETPNFSGAPTARARRRGAGHLPRFLVLVLVILVVFVVVAFLVFVEAVVVVDVLIDVDEAVSAAGLILSRLGGG